MHKSLTIKTQLIVFLSAFALFLSVKNRDATFLLASLLSAVSCLLADTAVSFWRQKKIMVTESSLITGLIIGFVLYSKQPWWIIVFASLCAILSKHIILLKQRHLFNPAAFGIFVAIILFHADTQWRGTYEWHILVPFGLYFIVKIRKLELLMGYFLASLALFGSQALLQKISLLNIFGYFSYFYVFLMLIEPKTTPVKPLGKVIFGIGVAVFVFILTQAGVRFDVELCGLLVFNIMVPWLDKLSPKRVTNGY